MATTSLTLIVGSVLLAAAPQQPEAAEIQGTARYYSNTLHGRKTASGEPYNRHRLTAAHRTLPLGTWVRVTHLGNGRSVVVRINDRGPFGDPNCVVDLSLAAAKKLGMVKAGVAMVKVQRAKKPKPKKKPKREKRPTRKAEP